MIDAAYEFTISEESQDPEWDRFVEGTGGGHHVQTCAWASVKASLGWRALRISARRKDIRVAGAQILTHKYPLIGWVGYVPKGPLCVDKDPVLISTLVDRMKRIAFDRKINMLAVQPPNDSDFMADLLVGAGFRHSTLELAPVATILIDVSQDPAQILARAKRQTRQNINRSIKEGITVDEAAPEELPRFYDLHVITSKRQRFRPYAIEYFETMQKVLAPPGWFRIICARFKGEMVSALLLVPFRDTVTTKILGWSGGFKEQRPNEAVFWGAVLWAKAHGYRYLDLEGIDKDGARKVLCGEPLPDKLRHSPDQLKYGFSGTIMIYPETFDLISKAHYRWLINLVKPEVAQQSLASKVLDLMRKR
jgi:lipid II:glycine glycyltransferase (peptidoglycan interpeptide bridge formation enzyme)